MGIEPAEPNAEPGLANGWSAKTASQVARLREAFRHQTIFGRSGVMGAIGIKSSRASTLLREMVERGTIEPVSGHGKGRYRFCQQAGGAGCPGG